MHNQQKSEIINQDDTSEISLLPCREERIPPGEPYLRSIDREGERERDRLSSYMRPSLSS